MTLDEALLLQFCRKREAADLAKEEWTVDDPLSLAREKFPGFLDLVRGKRVVDFGSGDGHQSLALLRAGATRVLGLEVDTRRLALARDRIRGEGVEDSITFAEEPTPHLDGGFDVVLSQNAMEHFDEPEKVLHQMRRLIHDEGRILITFGPPWLAPYGSHMHHFVRVPWINILFREKTVMKARTRFRDDGYTTYREAGLNRMTIRRYEKLIAGCGMKQVYRHYAAVKGISLLSKLPLLRELFIIHATSVLQPA